MLPPILLAPPAPRALIISHHKVLHGKANKQGDTRLWNDTPSPFSALLLPWPLGISFWSLSGLFQKLLQKSSQPVQAECLGPLLPSFVPDYQLQAESQSRASCMFPWGKPPGSLPGGKVLPGPGPRTDHGGEGQGSQEREEAEVEQALDAIIADASKGVQVVLQEKDMQLEGRWGQSLGSELVSDTPCPQAWAWDLLPFPILSLLSSH